MRTLAAPSSDEKTKIQKIAFDAVEKLREGCVIAIAVENAYVVIADATSDLGLSTFKSIKDYEGDFFYPLFVSGVEDLINFVGSISSTEKLLSSSFWPGLLNIEFKASKHLPHNLGADNTPLTLIARKPKNPLLNAITDLIGPTIYTSLLNDTSEPIKNLKELSPRIKKIIALGINSGEIKSHRKATLVSCVGEIPKLTRAGTIRSWKIKKVVSTLQES